MKMRETQVLRFFALKPEPRRLLADRVLRDKQAEYEGVVDFVGDSRGAKNGTAESNSGDA